MPNIKMPDGQIVAFPDDMPREQINSMILSRYPDLNPNKEQVPNAVKWAVNRMQKEGRTEPSLWENIVVGLSGGGQGAGTALSKGATGLSLGASDWALRKAGLDDSQARVNKIVDSTKSPTVAGLVGLASGGSEVAGGLPLGAGTFKLAAGLPKYGKLAAGVGTSAAMGGTSSAFNSDFNPEETTKGALLGAAFDLGLRGAGKGLAKVFSAAEKIKGVPRGLANAAGNDKGAAILDRAVKESKKAAKEVYAQAPEALDTINRRATEQLDDAVRGVDVKGQMAGAKKAYGDYIDTNKAKQIINGADDLSSLKGKSTPKVSDLGISDKLSKTQNKALNTAWKQGADSLKKGEAIGSLKHIDEMKKSLNSMIEKSKVSNPNGVGTVDTSDTVALRELKGYLQETMDNAGLSGISKQYREAKRLEEAFNAGKKFNPNAQKVSDFKLKTADERNAFAQGLADRAKLNPESKNIAGKVADVRGALRETIGEKANPLFNNIDDLDRTYQNVSNLRNLANRKLVKTEPIGKLTAGPIREWGDSKLSPVFALADVARRFGTGMSAERAAKYLLNPNLKIGRSWNDAIQPAIPSISTYLSNKRNKKKGDK